MFTKSIRWRIQAWHGALLISLVMGLLVAFYAFERSERFREVDNRLHALFTPLLPRILGAPGLPRGGMDRDSFGQRPPRDRSGPHDDAPPVDDSIMTMFNESKYYYVCWSDDHNVLKKSADAPADVPEPLGAERAEVDVMRSRGNYREIIHLGPHGDCALIGTSTAAVAEQLHWLALKLSIAGIVLVGAGLFVGWWSAGRALRPITEITAAANQIAAGRLSKRIPVPDGENELARLATVLNNTFERLENAFEQEVRFTADASHELRTPISVILTQIQLALSRERSPEEYRKTLETCGRAAERMRVLVNQLLELARVDSGEFSLLKEKCDLSRIGRESLDLLEPLALQRNVKLKHSLESVMIRGDALKLGQVMINLLNNAIHHNPEGIELSLSVQQSDGNAVIKVRDNGAGIPPDALPHIFDRFYRVDKSRSRVKGNSGLGLAISKAIVDTHDGTIRAESEVGKGTEFTITLPLNRDLRARS